MHTCKNCGKEFTEKYSKWCNGNFCCKECARSYSSKGKRQEINERTKYSLIAHYENLYNKHPKECSVCGNVIPYSKRKQKTCSMKCAHIMGTQTKRKNGSNLGGGYRLKGHRKSKKGYYKGIYCDSTYELAYLIYCLDHNIDIKRCNESFEYEYEGKKHRYHPDFVVNGEIIEIKGYHTDLVDIKLKSVDKPIKILYYEDMKDVFDYVCKTYNKKYYHGHNNLDELYSNNVITND